MATTSRLNYKKSVDATTKLDESLVDIECGLVSSEPGAIDEEIAQAAMLCTDMVAAMEAAQKMKTSLEAWIKVASE